MNHRGVTLALALLPLFAGTGCATYGPTWSEVSGERYNVTIMHRRPGLIQKVDGTSAYVTYPIKLDPGQHVVEVGAYAPGWVGGPPLQSMTLALEPCKRYYLNAQFNDPISPNWQPVVDYVEPIAGCRTLTASK